MNCYYVTVVDCLTVAPRKIQHDSCSSQIVHVFQHCRALTVNLPKILYNSQASVGDSDKQYTIILFISNILFLPTILNYLNDRERGTIICCRILAPPTLPQTPLNLTIVMTKRGGGTIIFCSILVPSNVPPPLTQL